MPPNGSFEEGQAAACLQRPFKRKPGCSSSVRLLGISLISLAVVYLLLRCLDLTRERHRVVLLRRSLAAGDDTPCHGDDENNDDEEADKDGDVGNFGLRELGGLLEEQQVETSPFGHPAGQTERNLRWPSAPERTDPRNFRGSHGFASGWENANAAALWGKDAGEREGDKLGERRRPLRYSQSRRGGHPGPREQGGGNDYGEQMQIETELINEDTLGMWESRNVPPEFEVQLNGVFKRMMEAVSHCRSLLEALSERHKFQLSFAVIRLLGMQLGAISLVRRHLEPLRSCLGDALAQLGFDTLQHTAPAALVEKYHARIRDLLALVVELKHPRPHTEEGDANRYRVKMVTILRTAVEVVGYCLGVLEGMLKYKDGARLSLPSSAIDQQIAVVEALYRTHSSQIAMDSLLRYFIVNSQKRLGINSILGMYHYRISGAKLPPLREMVGQIHEAVEGAGGLLQAPATPYTKQYTSQPHTPQRTRSPDEVLSEPAQQFTPAPQLYLAPPGVTTFQSVQLTAASTHLSHPRFPPPHVRYYASQFHQAQPPPSPYSHRHFGSSVSRSHHQQQAVPSIPSQATTRTTVLEQHQLVMPTHGSGRGDVSATVLPYSAVGQEAGPLPQPYSQQPRPILVGPYAHAGAPRYPSQSAYSISDHGDRPPLLQPATRRTVGMSSWGYRTLEGDSPQQEEEEEVEEVEGLLEELIKGGLTTHDAIPARESSDA